MYYQGALPVVETAAAATSFFLFLHCRPVKQRLGKGERGPLEAAQLCCPLLLQLEHLLGGFHRLRSGKGLGPHSVSAASNWHLFLFLPQEPFHRGGADETHFSVQSQLIRSRATKVS